MLLNRLKVGEDVLVTDDFYTVEMERERLFKVNVCVCDYEKVGLHYNPNKNNYERVRYLFTVGKRYGLLLDENGAVVKYAEDKLLHLSHAEIFGELI